MNPVNSVSVRCPEFPRVQPERSLSQNATHVRTEIELASKELKQIVEKLYKQFAGAVTQLIGGARSIHPNAFKENIVALKNQLDRLHAKDPKDVADLKEIKELVDRLYNAYDEFVNCSMVFPGLNNPTIRIYDKNGNRITQEKFDSIKANYQTVIKDLAMKFKVAIEKDANMKITKVFNSIISGLMNFLERLRL